MSIRNTYPTIRPSLNLNFARSRTLDPRITFSRSSVGTYMDSDGLIKTAIADQPRFDHRYVNGQIESLGLLIEEQRTNLMPRSQDFSASPGGWTLSPTGASRTQNLIGPDGVTNSAWTITDSNNTGDLAQFYKTISISASSSTKYCISCFMKDVDNVGITPDLYAFFLGNSTKGSYVRYTFSTDSFTAHAADGGGIQPSIYGSIPYPNGWVRLYFVVDDSNNGSNTTLQFRIYPNSRDANKTGSMGFFGVQIEIGEFPTSYIPALGSQTVIRNPDNVSMTGTNFTDWYNINEGSILWIGNVYTREVNAVCPYKITQGSNLRGIGVQFDTRSGLNNTFFISRAVASNIPSETAPSGTIPSENKIKIAGSYEEGVGISAAFNGQEPASSSGTSQTDIVFGSENQMDIGGSRSLSGSNNKFSGVCERLVYYPRRLTNAQLQNLTK